VQNEEESRTAFSKYRGLISMKLMTRTKPRQKKQSTIGSTMTKPELGGLCNLKIGTVECVARRVVVYGDLGLHVSSETRGM
jgi:hypothetical protein